MDTVESEVELRDSSRITLLEAEQLIDGFYETIGVPFKFNNIIKDGTIDIISTNNPNDATYYQLTHGHNNYIGKNKNIEIYNNGLVTDTIIWVHEISHYRNQPEEKRGEVNNILTELLAYTEEFLYIDYLEKEGYQKEAKLFRLEEYQSLHCFIKQAEQFIKIYLLYFLLGSVSKENFKYLYKDENNYEKYLDNFMNTIRKDQDAIFNLIWYSIAVLSIYNYEKYKEDINYLNKIKKLNQEIMDDISLEDALEIMDIRMDNKSLKEILERINNFKNKITINQSANKTCKKIELSTNVK